MQIHRQQTVQEMGAAAARHAANAIRSLTSQYRTIAVVFATGASQLETLHALVQEPDVAWDRVIGFHMDEYLGIPADHPAAFRRYLRDHLVSHVRMKEFHEIDGSVSDPERVCREYADLLRAHNPRLCLGGIGENGHLAFNDPHEADFSDPVDVKVVSLDSECRTQQVAEGWFPSLDDVPSQAITLTIPCLLRIPELILSVPGERKCEIVRRTVEEPISAACPSTILRSHGNAHVYLDAASSALL